MNLSPSKANQWVACPAAPTLQLMVPEEPSEEAALGTRVHALIAAWLTDGDPDFEGMEEHDIQCARDFVAHINEASEGYSVKVEAPVFEVYGEQMVRGRIDVLLQNSDGDVIIYDYKHGRRPVTAEDNWQLRCYADLLPRLNRRDGSDATVEVRVYQPRSITGDILTTDGPFNHAKRGVFHRALTIAVEDADAVVPDARAGSHCVGCAAKHLCPAALQLGLDAHAIAQSALPVDASVELVGARLTFTTDAVKLLSSLKDALEAQLVSLLQSGAVSEEWRLEGRPTPLKWTVPEDVVLMAASVAGVDIETKSILTPTQALNKKLPKELVEQMAARGSSIKLMKTDPNKAKEIFK